MLLFLFLCFKQCPISGYLCIVYVFAMEEELFGY
jgi:hypothetical protein